MTPLTRRSGGRLHFVITAGPTREPLDPVRFLSNYSTGTMGYALAEEAARRGHSVVLISGPSALPRPKGVRTISVETALQMRKAILRVFGGSDAVIMAAAVCDWRPLAPARRKIKRSGNTKRPLTLRLVENPDILGELGKIKKREILVGFALETEQLRENAIRKLALKNLDLIVANRHHPGKSVFGRLRATFVIIDRTGTKTTLRNVSKSLAAKAVVDKVEALC